MASKSSILTARKSASALRKPRPTSARVTQVGKWRRILESVAPEAKNDFIIATSPDFQENIDQIVSNAQQKLGTDDNLDNLRTFLNYIVQELNERFIASLDQEGVEQKYGYWQILGDAKSLREQKWRTVIGPFTSIMNWYKMGHGQSRGVWDNELDTLCDKICSGQESRDFFKYKINQFKYKKIFGLQGGKRKARKTKKARKARKTKKARKSRKSHKKTRRSRRK